MMVEGASSDNRKYQSQQRLSLPIRRLAAPVHHHQATNNIPRSEAVVPSLADDSLRAKVLRQIEYWLSDDQLKKDDYILKKMRGGWIPIRHLAKLKQIQRLNLSIDFIADSLRSSTDLVVSEDGREIQRRVPFSMEKALSADFRTIVVRYLPDNISEEGQLMTSFSTSHNSSEVEHVKIVKAKTVCPSHRKGQKPPFPVHMKAFAFIRYADMESAIAQVTQAQTHRIGWRAEVFVGLKCGLPPSEAAINYEAVKQAGREADERRALRDALAGAWRHSLEELEDDQGESTQLPSLWQTIPPSL
uniref:HTH La-type RNA-binding domain-containing protein n=1 Tax=Heterosigma akashiwo TaxID=2829 RepID=A0A7S4D6Z8_HETAK